MKYSSLDYIIQPRGRLQYGSIFSKALSIARKNNVDPRVAEMGARGAAKLSSANPKKSQLVFKQQIDPYSANQNPITRSFPSRSRMKISSVDVSKDKELFQKWKNNPTGENLKPLLKQFDPLINSHINKWENSGIDRNILKNQAQNLMLKALKTYEPNKGVQLSTHISNNLRPMSRFVDSNQNLIRIPEEKLQQYRKVTFQNNNPVETKKTLEQQGKKLSEFKPMTEQFYSTTSEAGLNPVMDELSTNAIAMSMVYDKLDKVDQQIFQHTFGYKGAPLMSNKDIAKTLKISPPAVTKRKNKILQAYHKLNQSLESL